MRDPYDVLGIPRSATAADIKAAYRRLVKQYHPDRHPGDAAIEQRFKEVQSAYELLGDPEKRQRFDRREIDAEGRETASTIHRAWEAARASRRRGRGRAGSMFEDFFARHDIRTKGADVSYDLRVGFVEAVRGGKQRIVLQDGRTLDVAVPEGTADGDLLRLRGRGTRGLGGGEPGDALVRITVAPHTHFTRKGADIHLDVPVTLREAALGASVDVPTPHGRVSLRVPPGSNAGRILRLKAKGALDRKGGNRGDFYVRLTIVIDDPADLELARFLRNWKPEHETDPRADLAGL